MNLVAKIVCLFVLAGASASCVHLRQVGAATSDYADYRAFRVAPTLGGRLKAASFYLRCHADGEFKDEVSEWFDRVEPLFFEATAGSPAGMQAYLDALPDGPHAVNAKERREALLAAGRAEAGERLAEKAAEMERRLAAAAQGRENVLAAYASWIGRMLDFDAWGKEPAKASEEFRKAWEGEPTPKCEGDRCDKLLSINYELEVGGKPEPYVGIVVISLGLKKGKVIEGVVSGPDLIARLGEAHAAEPVDDSAGARARAMRDVIELTGGAIERRLPRERCEKPPRAPAILVRECDGMRIEIIPRTGPDGEDRVVIRGPRGL